MSLTNVVTVEAVDEKAKRVLQEFLSMYFDGATHWCGSSTAKTVPSVSLVFGKIEVQSVRSLPVIGIVKAQRATERKWGRSTGENVKQDADWTFTVWVDRQHSATVDGVICRGARLADVISDRLGALLTVCRFQFTNSGLKILRTTGAVPLDDKGMDAFIRSRTVRIRTEFAALFGSQATLELSGTYALV
jgi:hypothetical protein